MRKDFFGNGSLVGTIYLGGGTPSLLPSECIGQVLKNLRSTFPIAANPEVTLEANPDDLTLSYLKDILALGVNRLSIGVQSFSDADLSFLGRRHDAAQALESVAMAHAAGFSNISIDLMYGIPHSTPRVWEESLRQALGLPITHMSCYHLTLEPNTPLAQRAEGGLVAPVSEERSATEFGILRNLSERYGFEHYEVSNLAREGFRSRHNSAYWQGVPYLGLGPSAHSYNGGQRFWNPRSVSAWEDALRNGGAGIQHETLTPSQRQNEYLITSLRTLWGVNIQEMENIFGDHAAKRVKGIANRYIAQGAMEAQANRIWIKPDFFLVSDGIICNFMVGV